MSLKAKNISQPKKGVNIFLCHNPFHVYISTQICLSKFPPSDFDNLIITSVDRFTRASGLSYLMIGKGWRKVIDLWKAKLAINRFVSNSGPDVQLFLPHVDGILSNYMFESGALKRKGAKINFYYEGVVMVDANREARTYDRFILQKRILSLSILHLFVKHKDLLPLNSPRVHKVYTPYAEKTNAPGHKKEAIVFSRQAIAGAKGGVLIVGVDEGSGLEEGTREMISVIRNNTDYKTFFFKPHYADKQRVFENEAKRTGFEYTMVNDTRCIEEIIGGLPVEVIMCTHFSSALLNLKLIYRDELKVLFLAHPKALGVLEKEYIAFILSAGVDIVELKH